MAPASPAPNDMRGLLDTYAIERIKFRVDRLSNAFGLSPHEAEDLRQDMMLELLKAVSRFDPARAKATTFINGVLDQHYRHVLRDFRAEKGRPQPGGISSDVVQSVAVNDPRAGELSEDDKTDLRIDVAHVLERMPADLRRIAALLQTHKPAEIAKILGIHRGSVFRAIDEIRKHFLEAGYMPDGSFRATKSGQAQM